MYCNRPLRGDATPRGARTPMRARRCRPRCAATTASSKRSRSSGSEADILLVVDMRSGERRVAKLYRKGIEPDFRLLDDPLADRRRRRRARARSRRVRRRRLRAPRVRAGRHARGPAARRGPLPRDDVRAHRRARSPTRCNGIHAHRILHRDLKPENVLVRSRAPLELALTDFGIASLSDATQHFTSGARTTKYAAPEVLTGVLDEKSDWWSLGMIALEAASGPASVRRPDRARDEPPPRDAPDRRARRVRRRAARCCAAGCSLRDPKRRWGAAEVARWLAGDPTLAAPEDDARRARCGRTASARRESTTRARARARAGAGTGTRRARTSRAARSRAGSSTSFTTTTSLRKLRDIQDHREPQRRRAAAALPARRRARPAAGVARPAGDDGLGDRRRAARGRTATPTPRLARLARRATTCSRASPARGTRRSRHSTAAGAKAGTPSPRCGRRAAARRKRGGASRATSAAARW